VPASIPCEATNPRFFFKYHSLSEELQMASPTEFGMDCSQSDTQ
jgi:hypothetical protein